MSAELRVLRTKRLGRKPGPIREEPAEVVVLPHVGMAPIDHELIEGLISEMPRDQRAAFWLDHVDILGRAFLERGIALPVVEAMLSDHFQQVRAVHAARAKREAARSRYAVNFDAPPPVGTEIDIRGMRAAPTNINAMLESVDDVRETISNLKVERDRAAHAPRPASEILAALDQHLDDLATCRGEEPEVRDVHVTAGHDLDTAPAGSGKVCRHDLGGAPQEGEGRRKHPPHSNRHERRNPGGILALYQLDGIEAIRMAYMERQ